MPVSQPAKKSNNVTNNEPLLPVAGGYTVQAPSRLIAGSAWHVLNSDGQEVDRQPTYQAALASAKLLATRGT